MIQQIPGVERKGWSGCNLLRIAWPGDIVCKLPPTYICTLFGQYVCGSHRVTTNCVLISAHVLISVTVSSDSMTGFVGVGGLVNYIGQGGRLQFSKLPLCRIAARHHIIGLGRGLHLIYQ